MINQIILIGHVGRAPEIRKTQDGKSVLSFSVATTETYTKDGQKQSVTDWHDVTLFNPAQFQIDNVDKGTLVYVQGKLKSRTYEKKNGEKATKYYVLASVVLVMNNKETTTIPVPQSTIPSMSDLDSEIPF